jgi:chemotaxis protein CheZ
VLEALSQLENRLGRFAKAVNVRDNSAAQDPEEALRQARREMLLLNGPAAAGQGIAQDDIDKMFS